VERERRQPTGPGVVAVEAGQAERDQLLEQLELGSLLGLTGAGDAVERVGQDVPTGLVRGAPGRPDQHPSTLG
jgi:hypothetical protein